MCEFGIFVWELDELWGNGSIGKKGKLGAFICANWVTCGEMGHWGEWRAVGECGEIVKKCDEG